MARGESSCHWHMHSIQRRCYNKPIEIANLLHFSSLTKQQDTDVQRAKKSVSRLVNLLCHLAP